MDAAHLNMTVGCQLRRSMYEAVQARQQLLVMALRALESNQAGTEGRLIDRFQVCSGSGKQTQHPDPVKSQKLGQAIAIRLVQNLADSGYHGYMAGKRSESLVVA